MTSTLARIVGLSLMGLLLAGCSSEPEAPAPAAGDAGPVYSGPAEEGAGAMPSAGATVEP